MADGEENQRVQLLRSRVRAAYPQAPDVDDATLRRFLRARSLNVEKACKFLIQHLKWRETFVPNGCVQESEIAIELKKEKIFLQGADKTGRPVGVILAQRHDAFQRDLEEFKKFVVYGFDKAVLRYEIWFMIVHKVCKPVYTCQPVCPGHTCTLTGASLLLRVSTTSCFLMRGVFLHQRACSHASVYTQLAPLVAFGSVCQILFWVVLRFFKKKFLDVDTFISLTGDQEKFILIADLKGYSYRNIDIKGYMAILDILQDHYPERLGRLFMLHVPYLFWGAWKIVYPFIDPNVREKIVFVEDRHIQDTLLNEIDASQLPEIYGGKLPLVPIQNVGVNTKSP